MHLRTWFVWHNQADQVQAMAWVQMTLTVHLVEAVAPLSVGF